MVPILKLLLADAVLVVFLLALLVALLRSGQFIKARC